MTDRNREGTVSVGLEDLLGVWTLVSWTQRRGEAILLPMGEAPVGSIVYTADGHVSVSIMRSGRPPMRSGDFVTASAAEKAAAFEGYLGYAGRYELRGDEIVHHIATASYPNWVGDAQVRRPSLSNGLLTLQSAVRIVDGIPVSATLQWKRP